MTAWDAVLIPGGGLLPSGDVFPWVKARLDRAIALSPRPTYFIPLSAGTVHKPPPLDSQGYPILESVAAARYLARAGVPAPCILPETISLDTIGNAYFARVQHTEPLGLRRLHVITSAFHLPRTQAIFAWIFQLSPPVIPYQLTFEAVPNIGIPSVALAARQQREATSLEQVCYLSIQLTTLAAVHHWLYREHDAYAIARSPQRITDAAQGTY
jgi:uncharacterized SAM-binding protein YcdF (DUF218 family)